MKALFLIIPLALGGCATADFGTAVEANRSNYKMYSDGQIAQQATLQACFVHNPDKSHCSILAAGTNATQTLAGRPDKIREPATNGELATGIIKDVVTGAVVYGIAQQASGAIQRGQDNSAAISSQGITAASKPPLVVDKPVIVTVPAGSAVLPIE